MGPKKNPSDPNNQTGQEPNRNAQDGRGQYQGKTNCNYNDQHRGGGTRYSNGGRGQAGSGPRNYGGNSRQESSYGGRRNVQDARGQYQSNTNRGGYSNGGRGQAGSGPRNYGGNSRQEITYEGNIEIYANHFPIKCATKNAYLYDVQIVPKKGRDTLYQIMVQVQQTHYKDFHPAYDGQNSMYSARELPFTNQLHCEVNFGKNATTYSVTIAKKKLIDLTATFEVNDALTFDALQCLNVILSAAPAESLTRVGRCFFDLSEKLTCFKDLGNGLRMYQGIKQAVIMGWKTPFVNVDVPSRAFTKGISILELIKELKGDPTSYLDATVVKELNTFLRGLNIEYKLPNDHKKKGRVNSLEADAAKYTFDSDNSIVVLRDYYKNVKNYNIQYPHLPCIWIGNKQRKIKIVIPIELCILVPGQVINNVNSTVTSKLIQAASTNTQVRKQKIMDSMKAINYQASPTLKEFGITVDTEMVKVPAQVLAPPTLHYKDNADVVPSKGVWYFNFDPHKDTKFYQSININKWAILCLDDKVWISDRKAVYCLQKMLIHESRYRGMIIKEPEGNIVTYINERQQQDRKAILNYFQTLKEQKYQLAFVVLNSNKKTDCYAKVKQVAELNVGFLTECVKPFTITRNLKPQVIQNILLKVNTKLNGINHILKLFPLPAMRNVPIMIMGADVTHPPPPSVSFVVQPSIAAVTASIEPHAFRYAKRWRLQAPKMEYITDLEDMTKELLMEFYTRNQQLKPQRIIFYRDGVADSQFEYVKKVEVQAIKKACKALQSGNYEPSITFIVVQKRHNTRFFPVNPGDTPDRKQFNVPVGTSVSQVITQPGPLPNFYLQSHASRMGVARPGKYRAIYDDADMNSADLQLLSYYLCYLCARCTSSISYPVPTYYAHLTAARAKEYCRGQEFSTDEDWQRRSAAMCRKYELYKEFPMYDV